MDFIHAHFGDTGPVLTSINTAVQVNHLTHDGKITAIISISQTLKEMIKRTGGL